MGIIVSIICFNIFFRESLEIKLMRKFKDFFWFWLDGKEEIKVLKEVSWEGDKLSDFN